MNAAAFSDGFSHLLDGKAEITILPDILEESADRQAYALADVIVGVKYDSSLPAPKDLTLFHVPGAGYDAVASAFFFSFVGKSLTTSHVTPAANEMTATTYKSMPSKPRTVSMTDLE